MTTPKMPLIGGGEEIEEFLQEMAKNDDDIKQMMERYKPQSKS